MTSKQIEEVLQASFQPFKILVQDNSAAHASHAQAQLSGGGHYAVHIVSEAFINRSLLERHRCIYKALEAYRDTIHALQIKAQTPEEWQRLEKSHD